MTQPQQVSGFTLVEVIIAMLVLSVGVLAMGASTGHVMAQIQASELRGERVATLREAAETLRGAGFGSLSTACANASTTMGSEHYSVSCTVQALGEDLSRAIIVTVGPGFQSGQFNTTVADTFAVTVSNPVY